MHLNSTNHAGTWLILACFSNVCDYIQQIYQPEGTFSGEPTLQNYQQLNRVPFFCLWFGKNGYPTPAAAVVDDAFLFRFVKAREMVIAIQFLVLPPPISLVLSTLRNLQTNRQSALECLLYKCLCPILKADSTLDAEDYEWVAWLPIFSRA